MTPLPIFFIGHKLKNFSERLDTTYRKLRWPQHVRPAFVTREIAHVYGKVWSSTGSRGLPILLWISPAFRVMNFNKATHEGNSFVGDQPVWSVHRLLHLPSSPCWAQVCDILKAGSTTSLCLWCGKFLSFILPLLLRASIPINKVTVGGRKHRRQSSKLTGWVIVLRQGGAQGGLRRPRGGDGEILGYARGTVKMWWVAGSDGEWYQKHLKDTGDSCRRVQPVPSVLLCSWDRVFLYSVSCHLSASLGLS